MSPRGKDATAVLRGLLLVGSEVQRQTLKQARYRWRTSSIVEPFRDGQRPIIPNVGEKLSTFSPIEVAARLGVVAQGVSSYVTGKPPSHHSEKSKPPSQPSRNLTDHPTKLPVETIKTVELISLFNRQLEMSTRQIGHSLQELEKSIHNFNNLSPKTPLVVDPGSDSPSHSVVNMLAEVPRQSQQHLISSNKKEIQLKTMISESVSTPSPDISQSPPKLHNVPESFSQMKKSKKFAPIMDPSVAELDLEKMLGLKDIYESNNLKAKQHKKIHEMESSSADYSNARNTADEAITSNNKSSVKNSISHDSFPDAFTLDDSRAIEEKLASLQMESFSVDYNAVEKSAQNPMSSVVDEQIDLPIFSNANLLNNSEQSIELTSPNLSNESTWIDPPILSPSAPIPEKTSTILPPKTSIMQPKTFIVAPGAAAKLMKPKPLATSKAKSLLSTASQARKVPESRLGRVGSFTGLGLGLMMGTVAEGIRKTMGMQRVTGGSSGGGQGGALSDQSLVLTEANVNRIVDTLCKVRGAALKLGQMLSLSDESIISPEVARIFERVRQSADYMPGRQLHRVLAEELGPGWRESLV